MSIGQEVTVHFNLRGNEYNGKYYVNLQAWRLDKGEGFAPTEMANVEEADDIPF